MFRKMENVGLERKRNMISDRANTLSRNESNIVAKGFESSSVLERLEIVFDAQRNVRNSGIPNDGSSQGKGAGELRNNGLSFSLGLRQTSLGTRSQARACN